MHTLGETYSVLTGTRLRVPPKDALALVKQISDRLSMVSLNAQEYISALEAAASQNITGGTIYDLLIAQCVESDGGCPVYLGSRLFQIRTTYSAYCKNAGLTEHHPIDLFFYHLRPGARIFLQNFNNDFANGKFVVRGVRGGGHALQSDSARLDLVRQLAQRRYGFGVIQPESVPACGIGTLGRMDGCSASGHDLDSPSLERAAPRTLLSNFDQQVSDHPITMKDS